MPPPAQAQETSPRTGPEPAGKAPDVQAPESRPERSGPPADPTTADAPVPAPPPKTERAGQRLNHDLEMLVTLVGMLTVLGAGLVIWQRQSG